MALVESKLMTESWTADFTTPNGVFSGSVRARYRLTYDTQHPPVQAIDTLAYATPRKGPHPIPKRGDTYSIQEVDAGGSPTGPILDSASGIYCRSVTATPVPDSAQMIYDVDVLWAPPDPGKTAGSLTVSNPLTRPPQYHIEYESESVAIEEAELVSPTALVDASGATVHAAGSSIPLVNAALRKFEDVLFEESQVLVLVVTQNVSDYTAALALNDTYQNTSNNDVLPRFGNAPAGTLAFRGATTSGPIIEGAQTYYEMQTRVAFKQSGWDVEVANVGMAHYVTVAPLAATYSDDPLVDKQQQLNGDEPFNYSEPQKLSATGTKLPSSTAGNFITYRTKPRISYALL